MYGARLACFANDYKCLKMRERGENDSFAKPLYGLTPVSRVRIPLSPPFQSSYYLPALEIQIGDGSKAVLRLPINEQVMSKSLHMRNILLSPQGNEHADSGKCFFK